MIPKIQFVHYECIIIGPDHYNTLNCVRALGLAKLPFYLILISNGSKSFVDKSKYCKNVIKTNDYNDIYEILKTISAVNKNKQTHIITTNDKSAVEVDKHFCKLKNFFKIPNVSNLDGGIIREMDKNRQLEVANEVGFDVPQSKKISLQSFDLDINSIIYPCIIKPQTSFTSSKDYFRICKNPEDLHKSITELKDKLDNCLIQQFVENKSIKLIGGVRTENNETIISGTIYKERIGHHHNTLGLAATGRFTDDMTLSHKCVDYLNRIDYHGPFSFEFVRGESQNKDYFLELNLRTDGLFYYYTKAGTNLPLIWVKNSSTLGNPLTQNRSLKAVTGMNEFLYLKEYFKIYNLRQVLKDFIHTDTFSIFSINDIRPFLYKLLNN